MQDITHFKRKCWSS